MTRVRTHTVISMSVFAACLLAPFAQATTISAFTGTQAANGSVTGFTATLTDDTGTPYPPGTPVTLQYQTSGGVAIGAPIATTTGKGGVVTVPPPPIPAAAAPAGNQVTITDPSGAGSAPGSPGTGIAPSTTQPLYWYVSGWYWTKNVFKLDPAGMPGDGTQHWFIEDGGSGLPTLTSTFTGLTEQVVNSGFDLDYVPLGGGVDEAVITGNASFIQLADGTYLSFPDGTDFGTIDIAPGATSGALDFSAIGVSGDWSFDSLHLYTLADVTGSISSLFTAPAISEATAPEPSTWCFLAGGLLLIALGHRRRAPSGS
jgi:hypothetical protein